jgi:hypothetical protein
MPYYAGTLNNRNDIIPAIVAACAANDWNWDATSNTLSKGAVFLVLINLTSSAYDVIQVNSKTSADGALSNLPAYIQTRSSTANHLFTWTWPANYEIFINDTEVHVVFNFNGDFYTWLAFGVSNLADKLPGTGMFYSVSSPTVQTTFLMNSLNTNGRSATTGSSGIYTHSVEAGGLFWHTGGAGYLHHGYPNTSGNSHSYASNPWVLSVAPGPYIFDLINNLPNTWNDEIVLLPIRLFIVEKPPSTTNNTITAPIRRRLVGELQDCRFCRNTYYPPGSIVTIGQDHWKIYPHLLRNTSVPNANALGHSGTFAFAVRYDGAV